MTSQAPVSKPADDGSHNSAWGSTLKGNNSLRFVFSHIGLLIEFSQTGISAIRSAVPENPIIEANTEEIQGRLSPNNHGALPPNLTSTPTPTPAFCHPTPQTILGHFIRNSILCNYMRVFSELWKLTVRNNDTKNKNKYKLGW